jgi:serine/threonine protein kinase
MKKDDIINDYKIIEEIGRGGMAVVYRAIHLTLNKDVAIKVLNKEFFSNDNIRKRFMAEGRNLFSLSHENLTRVTDLIDTDNVVAIVMEYIDGQSLKDYIIKSYPFSDDKIKGLFSQMLDSLSYIHQKGFIHRDIKPSNFMITKDGTIKLLDFGIAKNTDSASSDYTMTGTSQMMGTPMYMSPEQIKSTKDINLQTDIYSLGVVLWNMVTGSKPYDHVTLSIPEIQVSILKEDLPLTNTPFDFVIQKSLQKLAEDRFKNCDEFKTSLLDASRIETSSVKLEDDKTLIEDIVNDDKTLIESNEEENTVINQIKEVEKEMSNKDTTFTTTPPEVPKKKSNRVLMYLSLVVVFLAIIGFGFLSNSTSEIEGLMEEYNRNINDIDKLTKDYMSVNVMSEYDFEQLVLLLDEHLLLNSELEDYDGSAEYEEAFESFDLEYTDFEVIFDNLESRGFLYYYYTVPTTSLSTILISIKEREVGGVDRITYCEYMEKIPLIYMDFLCLLNFERDKSGIIPDKVKTRIYNSLLKELNQIFDVLNSPGFYSISPTSCPSYLSVKEWYKTLDEQLDGKFEVNLYSLFPEMYECELDDDMY